MILFGIIIGAIMGATPSLDKVAPCRPNHSLVGILDPLPNVIQVYLTPFECLVRVLINT